MSEGVGELAKALAKAQAEMKGATKDGSNQHFRTSYATLESVLDAWYKVGPKFGLSVSQHPLDPQERQGVLLRTVLLHESGQAMDSILFMPAPKMDPQAFGAAMTYARRYALMAMVGLAPVDDDAEAAMPNRKPGPTSNQQDDVKFSLAVQKFSGTSADKVKLGLQIAESGLPQERRAVLIKALETKPVQGNQ